MEVRKEGVMERAEERKIPVFTVIKNGSILKNIFVVDNPDSFSPQRNGVARAHLEAEETLMVGRHPDCDIMLTHPSVSRFHLRIHSIPSRQELSVTDLSSVHGTWVSDQKLESGTPVEVKEGDTIRIGGSSRIYRLHWIPLSRAYDVDYPFVSPVDIRAEKEQDDENIALEAENVLARHEAIGDEKVVPDEDEVLLLDDAHSSAFNEYTDSTLKEIPSVPLASPRDSPLSRASTANLKLALNEFAQTLPVFVKDIVGENSNSSCSAGEQQFDAGPEDLDCPLSAELTIEEADNRSRHQKGNDETEVGSRKVMAVSAGEQRSDGGTEALECHLFAELTIEEADDQSPHKKGDEETEVGSRQVMAVSAAEQQSDSCLEALDCPLFAELTFEEADNQIPNQKGNDETEVGPRHVKAVSAGEQQSDVCREDLHCPLFAELTFEEADNRCPRQKGNEETEVGSKQDMEVSVFSFLGDEQLSGTKTEDIQGPLLALQPLSETLSEVNPAKDQNQNSGMKMESQEVFDDTNNFSLCESLEESEPGSLLSEANQNPDAVMHRGSEGRSGGVNCLSQSDGHENNEKKGFISGALDVEESVLSSQRAVTGSEENQKKIPRSPGVRGVLSELNSENSPLKSAERSTTCNILSRRGKSASALQIRTNRSEGKPKRVGAIRKAESQKKEVMNEESILQSFHAGSEQPEPELFTPDKENLTPNTHIMKRLQEIGDIKENKSSAKAASITFSSKVLCRGVIQMEENIVAASEELRETEIFTLDKKNLTPNSHLIKRLQEVGKLEENKGSSEATRKPFSSKVVLLPDVHSEENTIDMEKENQSFGVVQGQKSELRSRSSKLELKQEELVLKRKTERVPFQPLREKSSTKSKSYAGASCTAARGNSFANCSSTRSPSNLSNRESRVGWTMVVDTSSLLDKESRKSLQLLQGLKGTQLVIPRTVLRELDGLKKRGSLLFGRTAEVASVLEWIEECMVKTKWWIHLQSSSEATGPTAPTPPASPHCTIGSSTFPSSLHLSVTELISPAPEDHVLECALLYRKKNHDGHLVLLSNDVTLNIKAMAEGVICETAREFYESLVNPFSERFMWVESSPRGQTWGHVDDVVLRERYNNRSFNNKKSSKGECAKGLKLILLHNSQYGQAASSSHPF